MKKAIPVLVALLLIIIVGSFYAWRLWTDKYSYGKEMADLDAYFSVSDGDLAVVLQDELVEDKVLYRNDAYYMELSGVNNYISPVFYADPVEGFLLYTSPTDTVTARFGENVYTSAAGEQTEDKVIAFAENDHVYVLLDYVKHFANFSYEVYDRHIQLTTQWGEKEVADTVKLTWVREKGGIKSPILREVVEGETVEVLERMENWSRVKTSDSMIGYIENKRIGNYRTEYETPVTDVAEEEYTRHALDGGVTLGFHSIGGVAGNDTLEGMLAETVGLKVVAPTWFSLSDNQGSIRSYGTNAYVKLAHEKGLQVWGVLDDFNYRLETGAEIDDLTILSSTTSRRHLVSQVVEVAAGLGLDGINVDFEKVQPEAGVHFIQFLRELSVECRNRGMVLSADNYVPFQFNDYYRLDIQGQILDYVLIMGYDEHWHGSKDPGSVASIEYVSNGLDRTCTEVPAEKVINALPFYTIVWKTKQSEVTDEYLMLNKQDAYFAEIQPEMIWDETTCQNYAEWNSDGTYYQVWLEDADSIQVKLNVMKVRGIGGVAAWRLGYGTPEVWGMLSDYVSEE